MTEAERYFLVVAEELNISKAAKRLFVSHQNISQHIRNLERQYGTKLILRKPKIALTPAGQYLKETLSNILVLESRLEQQINEMGAEFCGEVTIGMPQPRAAILVPAILERFYERYPHVKVILVEAVSKELSKKVLDGTVDMFIGVLHEYIIQLKYESLVNEKIYLVVPDNLLKQVFPNGYAQCIKKYPNGIDIKAVEHLPFAMNPQNASLRSRLNEFLAQEQVRLNVVAESNSHELQLQICRQGLAAAFCTQMHLYSVKEINGSIKKEHWLHVFPVNRLSITNELYIVYHKDGYFPPYKTYMKEIMSEVVRSSELLDEHDFIELSSQLNLR